MSSPPPTGLLYTEVAALRAAAGVSVVDFAKAFGVAPNVVERWETLGVATGPTALAIRMVAQTMEFDFPAPVDRDKPECTICAGPSSHDYFGLPLCAPCNRAPVQTMAQLGYETQNHHNVLLHQSDYELHLPPGREIGFSGVFLSEGLGTLLAKMFKEEPQIGQKSWDDAVYVQWVEPGLDSITSGASRDLIKELVTFGLVGVGPKSISVQQVASHGFAEDEIYLLCGLLASLQS